MSSHLTGSKRLAVIQRWINGHDDPNWEVLPTRKEGKYIVKKRTTPLDNDEETQENSEEAEETEETEEIAETPKKVKTPKVKPQKTPKPPKPQKVPESQDPTVNLEILNQLKLLGEEIKFKREKREQKRAIKEVVDKQIGKQKMYYPQEYIYQQPPQPIRQEVQEEPEPQYQPIMFQRRNRIFEGIQ